MRLASVDTTLEAQLEPELKNPRIMSVHRMQKGISRQAIDSASSRGRILNVGGAVAADDVVAGISRMRWIVDPKLRVVENVESFGAEFEIALAENLKMLQQRKIEIRAAGIVQRIASAISEGQTARSRIG